MSLPLTALLTAFIRLKDASSPGRKLRILDPLLKGPDLATTPDPTKLPRIIWCYWAQGYDNAPEIVKYCVASWKRHNPTWDVRFLTKETVSDYIDTIEMDAVFYKSTHFDFPRAIYSDFLRFRLLRAYGGVWVDADLLCIRPLDMWLHTLMAAGVLMFQRTAYDRPVLNGFIAAQKNNLLITKWSTTFESYFSRYSLLQSYYTFESSLYKHRSVQAYYTTHYILDFLIKFDRPTRLIFRSMPPLDSYRLDLLHNWLVGKGGSPYKATLPDLTGLPFHILSWKTGINVNDVERALSHQPQI